MTDQLGHAQGLLRTVDYWFKLPAIARGSLCLVSCLALILLALQQPHTQSQAPVTKRSAPTDDTSPRQLLSEVSLAQLHTLNDTWAHLMISQQQQRFNLNARGDWQALGQLALLLGQSAHMPDSYKLQWPQGATANTPFQLQMQLQPGRYRSANDLPTLQVPSVTEKKPHAEPLCVASPPPAVTLIATWPAHGYVDLDNRGEKRRVWLGQDIETTWQLHQIRTNSVTFKGKSLSPECPDTVITVAI